MKTFDIQLNLLQKMNEALGDLCQELVFVGATCIGLYVDKTISEELRPTKDVDCIVNVSTLLDFQRIEKKLISKGFSNDLREGAPICRYIKNELILDVLPSDPKILGFTNSWYSDGIRHKEVRTLPNNQNILVLPLAYFLATKFEAFNGRGKSDPRFSQDLEDIALMIDGTLELILKLKLSEDKVLRYLSQMAKKCLSDKLIWEAISSFFPSRSDHQLRLLNIFREIVSLN